MAGEELLCLTFLLLTAVINTNVMLLTNVANTYKELMYI